MMKLNDVSTNKFIVENEGALDIRFYYARKLLLDYNIMNYQMLKDFLNSEFRKEVINKNRNYYIAIILLEMDLKIIESRLEKFNASGRITELYDFDNLQLSQVDDNVLNITDERNRGRILLCSSPLVLGSGIDSIRKLSITQIKHLMGHVDPNNFKNCLLNLSGMTAKTVLSVNRAVEFYDEQVIRQYMENPNVGDGNLFFINSKEKKMLTEEQIRDIAYYMALNAKEFIWGNLTLEQKRKLLAISAEKCCRDMNKVQGSLINAISRYTTLEELENGILNEQEVVTVVGGVIKREKKRPVDRFIIK